MTRKALGIGGASLALTALAVAALTGRDSNGARDDRPTLALLTSLPLVFGESFGLEGGSPTLSRLQERYEVVPIAVADATSLKGKLYLLMAHPRAQPAEVLVELDQWVQDGGKVLLLADPKLDWESVRPIGDPLRPPPAFADTGLLAHWNVSLSEPINGATTAGNGDQSVSTASIGKLSSTSCELAGEGFVARCGIGKGRVTIIADADFLNGEAENINLLADELDRLETAPSR
jgi:hypothetical protein